MLNRLCDIGKTYYNFKLYKLKDIDKSCCKDEVCKMIDFDTVKESVVDKHSLKTISSCDGLKICKDLKQMDFIELKVFKYFKSYNKITSSKINRQINKFDFEKKINDSLFIVQTILNSKIFNSTKNELEEYKRIKKRYFIVVDIQLEQDGLSNLAFTLDFLSSSSNIDKEIQVCLENKVNAIEDCMLMEKTKLISCSTICENICEDIV